MSLPSSTTSMCTCTKEAKLVSTKTMSAGVIRLRCRRDP